MNEQRNEQLPLNNALLQSISGMYPVVRDHILTKKVGLLNQLGEEHVNEFLTPDEKINLSFEVIRFQVDSSLPAFDSQQDADSWWASVIEEPKFPAPKKLAIRFSCFHGSAVESTFNTMGEIIDVRSTKTNTRRPLTIRSDH